MAAVWISKVVDLFMCIDAFMMRLAIRFVLPCYILTFSLLNPEN
ncbi:hypothetical protein B4168_1651 [Anoxybacillus flavithermus]|nr:hypothetical protein B4168_1651 [Anoxybacillus flavithermus]OAO84306.1 hypothetical protein GT23_3841 [Parageobacillus thermoglucosidasius]